MGWAASLSLFKAKNGGHETPRSTGYLFPVGRLLTINIGGLYLKGDLYNGQPWRRFALNERDEN